MNICEINCVKKRKKLKSKMKNNFETLFMSLEQCGDVESDSKDFLMKPIINDRRTLNLTDINLDCLESIFKHLPPEDLLNIIDVSSRFRTAVVVVYHRHYAKKTAIVKLDIKQKYRIGPLDIASDHIKINDMKTSFQLLRNFGCIIKELEINCSENIINSDPIFCYINKFCHQRLNEVTFGRIPETSAIFHEPFSSLDTVTFTNTHLHGEITNFNKWFPNMQTLAFIDDVKLSDPNCIEEHFKSLKALLLSNSIPKETVIRVFQSNPQLRYLHFYCDYDGELLQMASKYLKEIELLGVLWEKNEKYNLDKLSMINGNEIYFDKLKTLYICAEKRDNIEMELPKIPITFGPITKLHFYSMCYLGSEFEDFLKRHMTVTNILVEGGDYTVETIVETLAFLQEVTFGNAKLDSSEAVRLMDMYTNIWSVGCPGFNNVTEESLKSNIANYQLHNPTHDENIFKITRIR